MGVAIEVAKPWRVDEAMDCTEVNDKQLNYVFDSYLKNKFSLQTYKLTPLL